MPSTSARGASERVKFLPFYLINCAFANFANEALYIKVI